jgi:hypothetical protein
MVPDYINNSTEDRTPPSAITIEKVVKWIAARIRIRRRQFDRSKGKGDAPESWHGNCQNYIEGWFSANTETQTNSLWAGAIWLEGNTLAKLYGANNNPVEVSSTAELSPERLTKESG